MCRRALSVLFVFPLILILSCAPPERGPKEVERENINIKNLPDAFAEGDDIPVLAARRMYAIASRPGFKHNQVEWRANANDPGEGGAGSFANINEAVEAGKKWLTTNFGAVPECVTFDVDDDEFKEWDHINFRQRYRGIPLIEKWSWVRYDGRRINFVESKLYHLEAMPGTTAKTISKEEARKSLDAYARERGATLEDLANQELVELAEPHLMYYQAINKQSNFTKDGKNYNLLFEPVWAFDEEGHFCVNAHSGKAFFEEDSKYQIPSRGPAKDRTSLPRLGMKEMNIRHLKRPDQPNSLIDEVDDTLPPSESGEFLRPDDIADIAKTFLASRIGGQINNIELGVSVHHYYDSDTIDFKQYFRGVPLNEAVWIQLKGREVLFTGGSLAVVEPIVETERKIITKEEAVLRWEAHARRNGMSLADAAKARGSSVGYPRLIYSTAIADIDKFNNKNGSNYDEVLQPAWVLDRMGSLGVNARTGRAWFKHDRSTSDKPEPPIEQNLGPKAVESNVSKRLAELLQRASALMEDRSADDKIEDRIKLMIQLTEDFAKQLNDEESKQLLNYALSEDGIACRFLVAQIFIYKDNYENAAKAILSFVVLNPEERRYRTWKWFETVFGERDNYKKVSLQFTDALLHQFESGDEATKIAIADLFSQGEEAAKLSLAEFKKLIKYDEAVEKAK